MRALRMAEATMLYLGGHLTYPPAQTSTPWGKMPLAADVDTCGKRFRSCQLIACEENGSEGVSRIISHQTLLSWAVGHKDEF